MDLRTAKTKTNIIEAFITLRTTKPIEKITIKELSDLAKINKATFYRHFDDIYALSESIEDKIIDNCLKQINDTTTLLDKDGIDSLIDAFNSQKDIFNIIFSGSRKDIAIHKFHNVLLEKIFSQYPEYRTNIEAKIILTTLIYGTFQAYQVHKEITFDMISNCLVKLYKALQ